MTRRIESISIRPPRQHSDFLRKVTGRPGAENSEVVFNSYFDALIFASIIGFEAGKREESSRTGDQIDPIEFSQMTSNKYFETLISTFAVLNNKNDHTCLSGAKAEDRIRMFEEYACAGLTILRKELVELNIPNGEIRGFVENRIVNQISSFQENAE